MRIRLSVTALAIMCGLVVGVVTPLQADTWVTAGTSVDCPFTLSGGNGIYLLCAGGGWFGKQLYQTGLGTLNWYSTNDDGGSSPYRYGYHTPQTQGGENEVDSTVLWVQYDGNVVLYDTEADGLECSGVCALWATNTDGYGSSVYLDVQSDGNIVVYYDPGSGPVPIWSASFS